MPFLLEGYTRTSHPVLPQSLTNSHLYITRTRRSTTATTAAAARDGWPPTPRRLRRRAWVPPGEEDEDEDDNAGKSTFASLADLSRAIRPQQASSGLSSRPSPLEPGRHPLRHATQAPSTQSGTPATPQAGSPQPPRPHAAPSAVSAAPRPVVRPPPAQARATAVQPQPGTLQVPPTTQRPLPSVPASASNFGKTGAGVAAGTAPRTRAPTATHTPLPSSSGSMTDATAAGSPRGSAGSLRETDTSDSSSSSTTSGAAASAARGVLGRSPGGSGAAAAAAGGGCRVQVVPQPPPGAQHPQVTFRNVAELRHMLLQGRQMAGEELQRPASTTTACTTAKPVPAPAPSEPWARVSPADTDGGGPVAPQSGASNRVGVVKHLPWGSPSTAAAVASDNAAGSQQQQQHHHQQQQQHTSASSAPAAPPREENHLDLEGDKDYQKAKRYALSTLQRTPLASTDLSRRLAARGHRSAVVSALVTWLQEGGALNDRLFARLYASSKWSSNLVAPAKIQKELAALGVAPPDVTAALTHVFGPSCRIRLTGPGCTEEMEVRETLVAAARRHVEQRTGCSASRTLGAGGGDDEATPWEQDADRAAAAAAAQAKDRAGKRRRLATWLQYRGHDMDLVAKMFGLLRI